MPQSLTELSIVQNPLPHEYVKVPRAIAMWVDGAVPCTVNNRQTLALTKQITGYLRSRGVSDKDINAALLLSTYQFDGVMQPLEPPPRNLDMPAPARLGTPNTISPVKLAERLDGEYQYARINHNAGKMKVIAGMLIDLLNAKAQLAKKQSEYEEVGREILRAAPNIARVVGGGPGGRGMAPGPDGRTPRPLGGNVYVLEVDAVESEAVEGEGEAEAD